VYTLEGGSVVMYVLRQDWKKVKMLPCFKCVWVTVRIIAEKLSYALVAKRVDLTPCAWD